MTVSSEAAAAFPTATAPWLCLFSTTRRLFSLGWVFEIAMLLTFFYCQKEGGSSTATSFLGVGRESVQSEFARQRLENGIVCMLEHVLLASLPDKQRSSKSIFMPRTFSNKTLLCTTCKQGWKTNTHAAVMNLTTASENLGKYILTYASVFWWILGFFIKPGKIYISQYSN